MLHQLERIVFLDSDMLINANKSGMHGITINGQSSKGDFVMNGTSDM